MNWLVSTAIEKTKKGYRRGFARSKGAGGRVRMSASPSNIACCCFAVVGQALSPANRDPR
jgi:hypothetical protein